MKVRLHAYPAKNGDCLLISFGRPGQSEKHLLVDCGFVDTYNNYLKKKLLDIANAGECIEKLIITHIDSDHIQGAIEFLKDNNSKNFIEIKEVWHNTFRHLFPTPRHETNANQERILKSIVRKGFPANSTKRGSQVISAKQGTTVGAMILQGKYSWNTDFNKHAVCIENNPKIIIDPYCTISLLAPDAEKLEKLKELWAKELNKYDVNYDNGKVELYDDAFEMLIAWEKEKLLPVSRDIGAKKPTIEELLARPFEEDDTATNGSSIAFILNIQGKRLLFLGDAHSDVIVNSLESYEAEKKIQFDLIKVSHHGSFFNISQRLLDKIDSQKYLFLTNGLKHHHPDRETIAQIISRKAKFHRTLYFNYITDNSEYFNRKDWMTRENYSIYYLNHAPYSVEL